MDNVDHRQLRQRFNEIGIGDGIPPTFRYGADVPPAASAECILSGRCKRYSCGNLNDIAELILHVTIGYTGAVEFVLALNSIGQKVRKIWALNCVRCALVANSNSCSNSSALRHPGPNPHFNIRIQLTVANTHLADERFRNASSV